MVDPVQLRLVDVLVELLVERVCGGEVVPERLLDDDPTVLGQTGPREPADDGGEQRRRNLEVEDRADRALDLLRDALVRRVVLEVAVDVGQAAHEPLEHLVVDLLARRGDRVVGALDEVLPRPVVEGDADDRALQETAALEPVERAKGHHPGEVAGDPEDHENVGRLRPAVRLPVHAGSISAATAPIQAARVDGASGWARVGWP